VLTPHPLSNKLAIVTALGQWLPLQSKKIASLPETEALMARRPCSKPIHAKEEAQILSPKDIARSYITT